MTTHEHDTDPNAQHDEHTDEWFRHSPDEPHAQHAHGEIKPVAILTFLSAVIITTFAVIGLFLVYFATATTDLLVERDERATDTFYAAEKNTAYANWDDTLNATPQWQDMDAGFTTLPLDRAKSAVVGMYNNP